MENAPSNAPTGAQWYRCEQWSRLALEKVIWGWGGVPSRIKVQKYEGKLQAGKLSEENFFGADLQSLKCKYLLQILFPNLYILG